MAYTYIEGDLDHSSGPNGTVTRVVIHATVSGCHRGGAVEVAHYFQRPDTKGLAHFVVDPGQVVQCAPENLATWHAPPNKGSLGIELCDPQAGGVERWLDADHQAMLKLAANLVVDLCHRHNVPLVWLTATDLVGGAHGITSHHEVSKAWRKSDHTDPDAAGLFPVSKFMDMVKAAAGGPAPKPTPAPHPSGVPAWYKRKLSQGMAGDDVLAAQKRLHVTPLDGKFGPKTKAAVVAFQKAHKLTADGVVGPNTAKAMG